MRWVAIHIDLPLPACVTKSFSVFRDANADSSAVPALLDQPFFFCLAESPWRKKLDMCLSNIWKTIKVTFDSLCG